MLRAPFLLNYFLLLLSLPTWAAEIEIFVTLKPLGSFVAKSKALSGLIQKKGSTYHAKKISLKLDTLKTGIELRDKHLRERYLQTKKFPRAILTSGRGKKGAFTARLKIKKKRKKIKGTYKIEGKIGVAEFLTQISDWGIEAPKYMGVGVQDQVRVRVKLPIVESKVKSKSKKRRRGR